MRISGAIRWRTIRWSESFAQVAWLQPFLGIQRFKGKSDAR